MPQEIEKWFNWCKNFGWHKPTANDLIPTPKQEPVPDVIKYQPTDWNKK